MKRAELAHILRAASTITGREDVVVLGSQSVLGTHDEEDLPPAAVMSVEADVTFFDDPDNDASDLVDMHLGEDSQFHATFGFYAHGIDVSAAWLPEGWQERTRIWSPAAGAPGRAICLDPHDLAVAKLAAGREKDHVFVAAILDGGLLDPAVIARRSSQVPGRPELGPRINRWVEAYVERGS